MDIALRAVEGALLPGHPAAVDQLTDGALSTATIALLRLMGAGLGVLPLWALVRATVQLAAIAVLLRGILAAPATVGVFVLLMLSTASWTSPT